LGKLLSKTTENKKNCWGLFTWQNNEVFADWQEKQNENESHQKGFASFSGLRVDI
jgi:hypothetical protein